MDLISKRQKTGTGLALASGVLALVVATALFATAAGARSFAAPVNRCAPVISGKLVVGKTITSTAGCWSNSPTRYVYQWLRCDTNGSNCVRITGATSNSYTLTRTDAGNTMIVLVTASNADGQTGPVNSKPSAIVSVAAAPENTTAPSITGKAMVGELLFANPGKYAGGIPTRYTYQWTRCNSAGASCTGISGETKQTYTVRSADVKFTLRVAVTAANDYGSDVTTSDRTAVVTTVPAIVLVTTSMTATRSTVTCCATSRLTGTVSTGKAGEPITILALEFGELAAVPIGTTRTTELGEWSFPVRPSIETTYRAKTSTSTGPPLTISVHPRVGLGFQRGVFSTKVTGGSGATSFAGKIVFFQRRTAAGRWVTLEKVVLDTFSVAKFKRRLPRGVSFVRVYLSQAQAGDGYLDGVSHTRRFRRR
ncbi:MAG: hypothetical protein ABR521_04000 [Gaiellaceae bacterium]